MVATGSLSIAARSTNPLSVPMWMLKGAHTNTRQKQQEYVHLTPISISSHNIFHLIKCSTTPDASKNVTDEEGNNEKASKAT
jgi:hypothetical protein